MIANCSDVAAARTGKSPGNRPCRLESNAAELPVREARCAIAGYLVWKVNPYVTASTFEASSDGEPTSGLTPR